MKRKLKGLIALIMAMAMVVSIVPSSFGAISNETFDSLIQPTMRVLANATVSISEYISENGSFSMDDVDFYIPTATIGTRLNEDNDGYGPNFYEVESWTIWEVDEDGCVNSNSEKKTVPADYTVTADDIKAYGCEYEIQTGYYGAKSPYIEANLVPTDYSVTTYDETGETEVETYTYNIENYSTKTLPIPEGYIGYMMNVKITNNSDESFRYEDVFVSSFEDIWTEREIMACFDYAETFEITKLIPTKKMPYYVDFACEDYYSNYQNTYNNVIWLAPGESIADNIDQMEDIYPHYDVANEDCNEWEVWRIYYCGSATGTNVENTSTGLSVDDYLSVKFDAYDGDNYADIYYYSLMYPILAGTQFEMTEYEIPVYDMKGNKTDETVCFNVNNYGDEEAQDYSFISGLSTKADKWVLVFEGKKYTDIKTTEDIWNTIFAKSNSCDMSKVKIKAECEEHTYDNGVVVKAPTVTTKGTTKYTCTKCGYSYTSDNVPKVQRVSIESVKLSQTTYTYSGSAHKPSVTVKAKGKTLVQGTDYTVSYKDNKNIGYATVTVKGKGKYYGTITKTYTIKPGKVTGLKQTGYEHCDIPMKWNPVEGATGYVIQILYDDGNTKYAGSTRATKYRDCSVGAGTEYVYIVRAYTNVNGKKIYGSPSVARTMMSRPGGPTIYKNSPWKKRTTLFFGRGSGADGVEIYMASSKYGKYKKIVTLEGNYKQYRVEELISGKKYYFKIRSYKYNPAGKKVYAEYYSNLSTAIIK